MTEVAVLDRRELTAPRQRRIFLRASKAANADWKGVAIADQCWYACVKPIIADVDLFNEGVGERYASLVLEQVLMSEMWRSNAKLPFDCAAPMRMFRRLVEILDRDRASMRRMYGHVKLEEVEDGWAYPESISQFLRCFHGVQFLVSKYNADPTVVEPKALLGTLWIERFEGIVFANSFEEAAERVRKIGGPDLW